MKNSASQIISQFVSIALFFLPINQNFAQSFQRAFGTNLDNSFTKVIQDGAFYYVLGQNESTDGALQMATVTRLDINGLHQWTLTSDVPSVFNDAILLPDGDLLVIGWTLPFDATNLSLIGRVTPDNGGYFKWLRSYNAPGREGLTRIVLNPMPQDTSFPYYTIGFQHQPFGGALADDVVLFTLDEDGVFGWKKVYPSDDDQEFFRDLEVYPNGDLLMAGNNASGVILKSDNAGIISTGVTDLFTIADVEISSDGDIYSVSNTLLDYPRITKFDQDLFFVWEVDIPALISLSQIWEGSPGQLYVTGRGIFGGIERGVVLKINGATQSVIWVKYLHTGSSFTGGSSWLLPGGNIAYTDSRVIGNGFGQTDAFISLSDTSFMTCNVFDATVDLDEENPLLASPEPPVAEFQDPQTVTEILNIQTLNWQQLQVCQTIPCEVDFIFQTNCDVVTFTGQTNVISPVWQWTFEGGNPSTSNAANPVVTFPLCGTYNVCVTVIEYNQSDTCTITTCHDVLVTDFIPPIARCADTVVQMDVNCEAFITPQMIDGGSTDDCMIQSMSVSPNVLSGCGEFPVTLTVTDLCGNTGTCIAIVQTSENTPPIIGCPANISINVPGTAPCTAVISNIQPSNILDNCSTPTVSYTITGATNTSGQNDASGTTFNNGVSLIVYTAEDECGNTGSCSFLINVNCSLQTSNITVTKYNDRDCDGLRDANDIGLSGWQFKLVNNATGNMINGITNVQGQFVFQNMPAGVYTLTETQQPGWIPTNPVSGSRTITLGTSNVFVEFGNCGVCIIDPDPLICDEPLDVLFMIDNSGSITSSEFGAIRNMVNNAMNNIGSLYSDAKFGVVHYGGTCGNFVFVEHDFKNAVSVFPINRRFIPGGTDDLHSVLGTTIKALNHIASPNLMPSPISFLNQRNGSNFFVIIFTDARAGTTGHCVSSLLPYTNANVLKQSRDAKITVVQLEPGPVVNPIGAAISSPGGTYTGAVAINGYDDPVTTGIPSPRQYFPWNFNPNYNNFLPLLQTCQTEEEDCCDSLSVTPTLTTTGGFCCAALDFENKVGLPITKFEAEIISSPGWAFNVSSLAHASGFLWESPPTGQKVGLNHTSGSIPIGISQQALSYCLASTTSTPAATQTVVFRWYGVLPGDSIRRVICTDTLITDCLQTTGTSCVTVADSELLCNPDNPYEYLLNFTVQNFSGSSMSQVILQKLPAGFGFSDCNTSNPQTSLLIQVPNPIPNGGTSSSLCAKIISPTPILSPQQVCFGLGLANDSLNCTSTDLVCMTFNSCCDPCEMTEATVEEINSGDECCFKMDLLRTCGYELFTKVETEILTPGVVFGAHAVGGPDSAGWYIFPGATSTSISFGSVNGAIHQDLVDDVFKFCLDSITSPDQIPQQIVVRWYTNTESGEEVLCTDTIILDVPVNCELSCVDGSFSDMAIRWNDGIQSQAVFCGSAPVTLGCPNEGRGYNFTGRFQCCGDPHDNAKDGIFILNGPGITYSGSFTSNPYFEIDLLPTLFASSGSYTLTLNHESVTQSCSCTIQFNVDCPGLCNCTALDIVDFRRRVERGFAQIYPDNSCTACFSPIALNDCESVEWFLNDTTGVPLGRSVGRETFCYGFPDAGDYNVVMNVKKKKDDGDCDKQMRTQLVTPCLPRFDCNESVFDNASFSQGAVAGGLNSGGMSRGWNAVTGEPKVIQGEEGSLDGWSIELSGNLDDADVLSRMDLICLEKIVSKCSTTVKSGKSNSSDRVYPGTLKIWLYRGDNFDLHECDGINCFELAKVSMQDFEKGVWVELEIPYDLTDWVAADSCSGGQGVLVRPVIFVTNSLGNIQGGVETLSFAQVDNFCLGGTIVAVGEPMGRGNIRIFPNPTSGDVTIEFEEAGLSARTIQVIDLYGRVMLDEKQNAGEVSHSLSIDGLSSGIYLIKVTGKDSPMIVEKMVKH